MKTIIQVWTHKCINTPGSFWGIGDILRGTLKVYQLCKKYNYTFIVDIQLHNLSNYLVNHPHEYSNIIKDNADKIEFVYGDELEKYLTNHNSEIIYFFTNAHCDENLDSDTKYFIKNILTPNAVCKETFSNKFCQIPENFNILHYRLGDEEIVSNYSFTDSGMIDHLIKHKEDNDILISDSRTFKCMAKQVKNINLLIFDLELRHIGFESRESLMDTMFEFFLITKSKKIKTYSKYGWVSGFVFWIHKIYDIPLTRI